MYKSNYRKRAEQAVEHYTWPYTKQDVCFHAKYGKGKFKPRKIKSVKDLFDAFEKRATTETQLRNLFAIIYFLLEPPSCSKTHCKFHTAFSFCFCGKDLVPGKCKENRAYLKRRKIKEAKLSQILNDVRDGSAQSPDIINLFPFQSNKSSGLMF
jgi:hypothetical protein